MDQIHHGHCSTSHVLYSISPWPQQLIRVTDIHTSALGDQWLGLAYLRGNSKTKAARFDRLSSKSYGSDDNRICWIHSWAGAWSYLERSRKLSTLCTVAISHCKTCLLPQIYILTSALYRTTQYRPTPILQTTVSISGKPDYDLSIPLTLKHYATAI